MQGGSLVSLSPAQINNFWMGLPQGTDKIDAVYERKTDSHIIFFIGSQFWVFKDTVALPGYPQPVSNWGMRNQRGQVVEKVEAAFVWAHNGKTYIFSEGLFWRFTEGQRGAVPRPDAEYPRNASLWKGAPTNPDDIMSWGSDGDTYFFKGNSYWVVKSGGLDQDVIIPKSTAVDWMFCPPPPPTTKSAGSPRDCSCGVSGASRPSPTSWLIFISVLIMSQCFSQLIRLG